MPLQQTPQYTRLTPTHTYHHKIRPKESDRSEEQRLQQIVTKANPLDERTDWATHFLRRHGLERLRRHGLDAGELVMVEGGNVNGIEICGVVAEGCMVALDMKKDERCRVTTVEVKDIDER